jgi:preprotein translocase subunit SecF
VATDQATQQAPHPDSGFKRFFTNQSRFDFIGRSRTWLYVSVALMVLCIAALAIRGLNFGIDFTGGASFVVSGAEEEFTSDELRREIEALGVEEATAQVVEDAEGMGALVSTPALEREQEAEVLDRLVELTGAERTEIDVTAVGPRWGEQVSRQALEALAVFLVLVVLYITLRFEWRMAIAALVTLLHDVVFTVGIYALVGFHVSPASVIALLTILGYSLYDTVVIFDRVADETAGLSSVSNRTYGELANEAVNEVLVRSLSTSVTSLLPVGSLLFLGATLLGAETLSDLALALFIGMAIGTYSSIFVATPLLVWLKEKEPRYAELKDKITARRGGEAAAATAGAGAAKGSGTKVAGGGAKSAKYNKRKKKKK